MDLSLDPRSLLCTTPMTILGIGVDLVHVPRIFALLSRRKPGRFAQKILSAPEYAQWKSLLSCQSSEPYVRFLAVRWSVKEAAYKAMCPIVRPTWKELTYQGALPYVQTKPRLTYAPSVVEHGRKIGGIHVSVSHDGEYVYSSVLVEVPTSPQLKNE